MTNSRLLPMLKLPSLFWGAGSARTEAARGAEGGKLLSAWIKNGEMEAKLPGERQRTAAGRSVTVGPTFLNRGSTSAVMARTSLGRATPSSFFSASLRACKLHRSSIAASSSHMPSRGSPRWMLASSVLTYPAERSFPPFAVAFTQEQTIWSVYHDDTGFAPDSAGSKVPKRVHVHGACPRRLERGVLGARI